MLENVKQLNSLEISAVQLFERLYFYGEGICALKKDESKVPEKCLN